MVSIVAMSGAGGSYPSSRQYDIPTSGFDLTAALVAAADDLEYAGTAAGPLRAIELTGPSAADGDVVVILNDDAVAITLSLIVGQRWVGSIKTVVFTGTTATGITGLR